MDIKDMALWAIEFLASSEGEPSQEQLDNIYMIAHGVQSECSAGQKEGKNEVSRM